MKPSTVLRRAREIYLDIREDLPGANFTLAVYRAAEEVGASEDIKTVCLTLTWDNQDAVFDRAIELAESEESDV